MHSLSHTPTTPHTHTHSHTHPHTNTHPDTHRHLRAGGLKKTVFEKRQVFKGRFVCLFPDEVKAGENGQERRPSRAGSQGAKVKVSWNCSVAHRIRALEGSFVTMETVSQPLIHSTDLIIKRPTH